jgi:hypothetical protein
MASNRKDDTDNTNDTLRSHVPSAVTLKQNQHAASIKPAIAPHLKKKQATQAKKEETMYSNVATALGFKVAVMDTRSGRSGGHKLKGPLECKHHRLWAAYDWIKGRRHSRNNGLSQSEKRIASLRIAMLKRICNRADKPCFGGIALTIIGTFQGSRIRKNNRARGCSPGHKYLVRAYKGCPYL